MRRCLILWLLLIMPAPEAGAEGHRINDRPLPENQFRMDSYRGYFRVVASSEPGDLVLHSAPSENSPKILSVTGGSIATSDGTTSRDSDTTWLRVAIEGKIEWIGWIHIRNLRHIKPNTFPGTGLAVSGFCAGYEPLWALRWDGSAARLSTFPGDQQLSISMPTVTSAGNATNFLAANKEMSIEAVFDGHACTPSQVQGLIGTSGLVIVTRGGQRSLLAGCCQVTAKAFAQ